MEGYTTTEADVRYAGEMGLKGSVAKPLDGRGFLV